MSTRQVSPAMLRAMRDALSRERRNVCPMIGTHSAAEELVLQALTKREYIVWDGGVYGEGVPRLSKTGEEAVLEASEGPRFTSSNTGGYTTVQLSHLNELYQQKVETAPGLKSARLDENALKLFLNQIADQCLADFAKLKRKA